MPRKPVRPKPFSVGRVRVRVKRGPRDDGRWYWRADRAEPGGTRRDLWVGWGTRDEVEEAVVVHLAQHDPDAAYDEADVETVGDLLDVWAASHLARVDIAEQTRRSARVTVRRIVDSTTRIVRVKLERVDRGTLERYRDAELRMGRSSFTVRKDLVVISQAWRWGREIGIVPMRDLPSIRIQREHRTTSTYTPTRAEVARLIDAMSHRQPWVRKAMLLLSVTGARIGEIASLTWGQVALDCGSLLLTGKTGPRRVPLHPSVQAVVAEWDREEHDRSVLGVAYQTVTTHLGIYLGEASAELGLDKVTPNGIRRSVTDLLLRTRQGADREAALLGHSPETALRHYRQVTSEELQATVIEAGLGVPTMPGQVIALPTRRGGEG